MVRTRRANRYCVDCGARLVYYPRLSNPKAPNEHRVLVYACPDCSDDFDKPNGTIIQYFKIRIKSSRFPIPKVLHISKTYVSKFEFRNIECAARQT